MELGLLPAHTIVAMFGFAVVSTFTPGPNNIMLAASGVNFGFWRTGPHMLGVIVGCLVMWLAIGFGLGELFKLLPGLQIALKLAGSLYLLWLAWQTARASEISPGREAPHPQRFWGVVLFQAVNPKVWVMAVSAFSLYVRPGHESADVLLTTLVFEALCVVGTLVWAGFGAALSEALKKPGRIRIFNVTMGVLLIVSIVPMVI